MRLPGPVRGRLRPIVAVAYTAAILAVAALSLLASLRWIDRPFPGFLLMPNGVVPSVALGHWTGAGPDSLFQRHVRALDGFASADVATLYDRVAAQPPGRVLAYTVADDAAGATVRRIPSMRFTRGDYAWFFGPLLLNGVVFTVVGLLVWLLGRPSLATGGATLLSLNLGLFFLTAMDLYGPGTFFRVHAAAEALVPATLLHLALVFPVLRLGRRHRAALVGIYLLDLALVTVYQLDLYEPGAYSRIHNLCMLLAGIGGVCFIASAVHAYVTTTVALVRKRLGIVALGLLVGFALPAWIITWSGLLGGEAPINLAAFTAFLFPLGLAYAVVKHDLFEIDAMIRRGVTYLVLTGIVATAYTLLVLGSGMLVQTTDPTRAPLLPVLFSIVLVLGVNALRARLQDGIDRLFDRQSHDAQQTLAQASAILVATLDLDDIYDVTIETPYGALAVDGLSLWMRAPGGAFEVVRARGTAAAPAGPVCLDDDAIRHLRDARRPITIYDHDPDEVPTGDATIERRVLAHLAAELVVPIGVRDLAGFLAVGRKRAGTLFTLRDLEFLRTFANQVAVAVQNARSYRKVEELNAGLEQTVTRRTSELAATNRELADSIQELERAYHETQRHQEELLRAEKLAALGRLTAGIAHEVNTPLGACLNALKLGEELVDEYRRSIGDPSVTADDHRELAVELAQVLRHVHEWTTTAAGYIRSIKAHTRSLGQTEARPFAVRPLIEDVRVLLSHRLRLSSCTLTVDCADDLMLYGDPGRLAQVLTNLVTNAIDAYESAAAEGVIRIRVVTAPGRVELAVEDDGCGIPPEDLARVFDELFTTKPPGKGTGLGLSICRDLIAECFGGRIDVRSSPGRGSRFALILPLREPADAGPEAPAAEAV